MKSEEWEKYYQEASKILEQIFYHACETIPYKGYSSMKVCLADILIKRDKKRGGKEI